MPNRILKESICRSDEINKLSWMEECLYYRLIVNCDDFGRFDGRVPIIKNTLFPLKDDVTSKSVESALYKLVIAGLVVLYEFEDKLYLHLPTWEKHQTIRAKKSKYPPFDRDIFSFEYICKQLNADVPVFVIQSEYKYESFTTTTTAREGADGFDEKESERKVPQMAEVYAYFREEIGIDNASKEADKFIAYNANRKWDCLPYWKAAADLWAARIE